MFQDSTVDDLGFMIGLLSVGLSEHLEIQDNEGVKHVFELTNGYMDENSYTEEQKRHFYNGVKDNLCSVYPECGAVLQSAAYSSGLLV